MVQEISLQTPSPAVNQLFNLCLLSSYLTKVFVLDTRNVIGNVCVSPCPWLSVEIYPYVYIYKDNHWTTMITTQQKSMGSYIISAERDEKLVVGMCRYINIILNLCCPNNRQWSFTVTGHLKSDLCNRETTFYLLSFTYFNSKSWLLPNHNGTCL